jgi:6-phosphogluconolactonase
MITLRLRWLAVFGLLALGLGTLPIFAGGNHADSDKFWVFIGTQTTGKQGGSKGIYRCELDLATGRLTDAELAAETVGPTFLVVHPNRRFLYSVNESAKFGEKMTGSISAYALDAKTGKLTLLNQQSSGGNGPCHVSLDRDAKCVLAANYNSGSICCMQIKQDGSLSEATAFIQHQGKSVIPARQDGPHAHSLNVDPANRFAFAADLGLDKLLVYRFDSARGTLQPHDPPAVDLAKGAGPRHFTFHPNGKFAYAINELDSTVTAMSYDADKGVLKPLQTISTLPKAHKGNSTAEVVVHPSGKFLYGSNRGHNSIAIFKINEKTGELTVVGHQDKDIKTPRNFAIEPTGALMVVANQDGNSLLVFRVDQKTGELTPTGARVEVPRPVCVRFVAKD